jgi:hypothetical protein
MRRAFALLSLLLLAIPIALFAKGRTVRIVIDGGDLAAPIEISDKTLVDSIVVGRGPGNFSARGPVIYDHGFIVQWSRGEAAAPPSLRTYNVSFVTTRTDKSTYIVRYAIDPATNQGYVLIPGKDDPAYPDNTWMILRGVEGKWFYAWSEWEKFAHPLIEKAPKKN